MSLLCECGGVAAHAHRRLGGALAVVVAAGHGRVRAAAAAAPVDFENWARNPRKLLLLAREIGVIRDPGFPLSFDRWADEIREVRAAAAAATLGDRDLMVIHGSDDETVPVLDARAIADACPGADLRIIGGAGHHLRHDPERCHSISPAQGKIEPSTRHPCDACGVENRTRLRSFLNPLADG